MAVTGSSSRGALRQIGTARPAEETYRQRRLTVVAPERAGVHLGRHRARVMVVVAISMLVGGVFVIGMGQNLLGTQQIRLDYLQQQLASATQTNENLLLSRAQLEAPARILQLAEHRLGMVTPRSVIYLTPVTTGPTVADQGKESPGVSR